MKKFLFITSFILLTALCLPFFTSADDALSSADVIELNVQVMRNCPGDSFELKVIKSDTANSNNKVSFSSSDSSVATVDSDGKVTSVSAGTAIITASSKNLSSSCKVYVLAENPAPVVFMLKDPENKDSSIKNVTVNCLGDSITTYAPAPLRGKNYHDWWAEQYYVKNNDYGVSGTLVTRDNGSSKLSFLTRYPSMTDNADLITVMGGTNDFSSTSVGTIDDRTSSTYIGALKLLTEGLIEKYSDKQIVLLSPIRRCINGSTVNSQNKYGDLLGDYAKAVLEVGKLYGVHAIDLYTDDALDFTSEMLVPTVYDDPSTPESEYKDPVHASSLMPDGLHPSGEGHEVLAEYILSKMEELGAVTVKGFERTDEPFIKGYDGNLFKPDGNMTRAEAVTLVTRLLTDENEIKGKYTSKFTDIKSGEWFYDNVAYLERKYYLRNFGINGEFKPNQPITRAEFVEIVYPLCGINTAADEAVFPDVDKSHLRFNSITNMAKKGLISGYPDGTFKPEGTITRAEVVKIVCGVLGRSPSAESFAGVAYNGFSDVSESHWAYPYIIEASNKHTATVGKDKLEIWI